MKILVVKTSSLGDVIHMLPAITDAAQAHPGLCIDWLVEESFAAVPRWHPSVSRVIPIAMRRWRKGWATRRTWQEIQAARSALQAVAYDLVIDSQGLLKSALWSKQAQGTRWGYDRASVREALASDFYDRTANINRQQHAIDRNRQLMAQALGYVLQDARPDYGLHHLASRLPAPAVHLPASAVMGLHGTSRADKLWPVQNWQALAQALSALQHTLVLPWGNEAEHQRAQHIAHTATHVVVLPKLGLDALAALLVRTNAVVGVDTGLLHLAAALGKPGMALYTATPAALTGAVSDRHARQALRNLSTPQELEATAVIHGLQSLLSN